MQELFRSTLVESMLGSRVSEEHHEGIEAIIVELVVGACSARGKLLE